MDAGKVDDAKQYMTAKDRQAFESVKAAIPGAAAVAGKAENKVDHVQVRSEDVQGDKATVKCAIFPKGGGAAEDVTMQLVKEDGKWRIAT